MENLNLIDFTNYSNAEIHNYILAHKAGRNRWNAIEILIDRADEKLKKDNAEKGFYRPINSLCRACMILDLL